MVRAPPLLAAALGLAVLLAGCTSPSSPAPAPPQEAPARGPYAGLQHSEVRGLTAQQLEELRSGAGAGLSLAAELNGYPGPLHVLELAGQLGLTEAQHARVAELREGVVRDAKAGGERVIAAHAALDQAFRAGPPAAAQLEALLVDLAAAEAALRGVHLQAHLATLDVLTAEQVQRYAVLRGYGTGEKDGAPAHHGAGHGVGH
jgi:Spy/CpxP family protein refolding chaperone